MYWLKSNLLAHKSRPHHFDGPEMMKKIHNKYKGEVMTNHIGRTGIWHTALQARLFPEGLDVDF